MKHTTTSILASLLLLTPLLADTIVLKSGKKLEGTVLSEDTTHYTVAVKYTENITDERRIPKTDVKEILRSAKDKAAFKKVKNLTPTPDRLLAAQYQTRIKSAQEFLTAHPKSSHVPEVKKILATLQNELRTIQAGGIKLDNTLLTSRDIQANAYDIHARYLLLDMRKLAAAGRLQPALRKWETLKNDYKNSEAYKDSLPLAARAIDRFYLEMNNHLESLPAREKKRQVSISSLSAHDQARSKQAFENEIARHTALVAKEEKQLKTKWLTVNPFHKASLETNKRNAESERNQLKNGNRSPIPLAGPAYRKLWLALQSNNTTEAAKHHETLRSLNLNPRYLDPLTKQLEAQTAAQKAAKEKAELERIAAEKAALEAKAKKAREEAEAKKNKKRGGRQPNKKEPTKPNNG